MKKFTNNLNLIGALLLVSLTIFTASCGDNNPEQKGNVTEELVPVETAKVKRGMITQSKTLSGTIEGVEQSLIVAKIAARITDIKVRVGEYVKRGQVIIHLDKTGPSSNYLQTSAAFENAKKDYERMKALFEAGAIAEQMLDQTKTGYEVAKANFEAAESTVNLTSPINGTITELKFNAGDWVTPGTQLAVTANLSSMIIKFSVSETEMQKLKLGDKVKVYSEFDPANAVTAAITEISRSASIDSRSFQVKAKFQNIRNLLYKPGMFANIDVVLESQKDVLIIPSAAITVAGDETIVYKLNGNISSSVKVKTGISNERHTEILSGLNVGETIVTLGMNNLDDSTKVIIVNQDQE